MQVIDWILIGLIIAISYWGFSAGLLAIAGIFLGLRFSFKASQSDFLRNIMGLKLGIASQAAVSTFIFLIVFLTFFSLSKVLTASLDNKSSLLWLPNRLLGGFLGTALAMVLMSQGWIWFSPAIRGLAARAGTPRIIAWSIRQDQTFRLSSKFIGCVEEDMRRFDGLVPLQERTGSNHIHR